MTKLQGSSIDRFRQGQRALERAVLISESIRRANRSRMGPDVRADLGSDRSHRVDSDEVTDE